LFCIPVHENRQKRGRQTPKTGSVHEKGCFCGWFNFRFAFAVVALSRLSRTIFTIKRKIFIFAEMPVVMDKRLTDKIVRYFATQPIVKAWVFGSYARGEAHSGSDIDILLVFDKEAKVSLMRHAKISLELSEILGFDVDLITEGTLLSFAERTANNDKILIYERAS